MATVDNWVTYILIVPQGMLLSPMYEYIIIVLSYVVHDIATMIHPSMVTVTAVKCTIMYTVVARQITSKRQKFLILFMTVHAC